VQVVGRPILERFVQTHAEVASVVDAWLAEARAATWHTPADIKARYANASILANNRVVFNLKGNKYRLDTKIAYQTGVVVVKRIGTHAEYTRWAFDN
jgi:mRNA interferase HigB